MSPLVDETLQVVREDTIEHDEYAVAITKGGYIVGHIPREIQEDAHFLSAWHHHM